MTVVNPKSISGINSITTGSGSDNLLTIHTSDASSTERVRINSSGDVIVGSGITVSPDGDIFATGVTTSTTFVGNLTGNVTGTASGNAALTGSTNNTVTTVTGANAIQGEANLTFDGDTLLLKSSTDGRRVSFATDGTSHYMKYDNTLSGIILNGYGGIAFETYGANERARIDSSGRLLIATEAATGASANADDLKIGNTDSGSQRGLTIGSALAGNIRFADAADDTAGAIIYNHSSNNLQFWAGSGQRATIDADGIKFGSDTAAANALDDYEEGTFTATISSGATGSVSFTHNKCSYIKIGRQVIFQMYLQFTGSGNGNVFKIGSLPFTASNYSTYGFGGASIVYQNNSFQNTDVGGHVQNLGTDINFYKGDGNIMPGNGGNLFGGADFILIGQYQTG